LSIIKGELKKMDKIERIEYIKISDLQKFLDEQKEVVKKEFPEDTKWETHIALIGLIGIIENAIK